ncbi:MAG: BREX system P-loop protein BrxC [Bacillota bacterium]
MIINRDVFVRDPVTSRIPNDGVASVVEGLSPKEIATLRYELEHFVCEGQYERGLVRILESYLSSLDSESQPAVWVSGFFGSGKSHLLKMLRHLWVNTRFADGATARGLANLPNSVLDLLRELDTQGKRRGGLHGVSGVLPSGQAGSLCLAILALVFRSKALPTALPQAKFCLWLAQNGCLEEVKAYVEARGRVFSEEVGYLYSSPILAEATLAAMPTLAPDVNQVLGQLESQFPTVHDITIDDFVKTMRRVLAVDGEMPCTVLALDEVQLFIGNDQDRSKAVQDVAEAICKQLDGRVLLIGAGQTALAADMALLQRLSGRFTVQVELSDADVETVTRRVVLAKKVDKRGALETVLDAHSGEISRQLSSTKIAARAEDRSVLVDDYPLLPIRRRFWESVLRAADVPGTASQLRTQLRIVQEAVRRTADLPLGSVVPGDFIFNQLHPDLLRTGVLLRELDETIRKLADGTPDDQLAARICGLVFLIRRLPREAGADIGVRATPDILADLLVSDLATDGARLRLEIPGVLDKLVEQGTLIKIDDEYSLQTRESAEWDREFRTRRTKLMNDAATISAKRAELLMAACNDLLKGIKLTQGKDNVPRKLQVHFGPNGPVTDSASVPLWIRDGWGESESNVVGDARSAGTDSPMLFVFIPKSSAEELQSKMVEAEAARATLNARGVPTGREGQEAREAMLTRLSTAQAVRDRIAREIIERAKVFQGGGSERYEVDFSLKVSEAAKASLTRLFPEFGHADDKRWPSVIARARNGDVGALAAIEWNEPPEKHPVCSSILGNIGAGKSGKEIRATFEACPYGWPRDAIDAALILLHTTGHLQAIQKGADVLIGKLDQASISISDFRVTMQPLDARQRIDLRALLKEFNVVCQPNEELAKASVFLAHLAELADGAGGEPPLPAKPHTVLLHEIKGCSGNDQLRAILEHADELRRSAREWICSARLAGERLPRWGVLSSLLEFAKDLPETSEIAAQAQAIRQERRLLHEPDPIPGLLLALADILRAALVAAHSTYQRIYSEGIDALMSTAEWQSIPEEQQRQILTHEGITDLPSPDVSSPDSILGSLHTTNLVAWKTRIDALPQRFSRAHEAAAKLLEPKAQRVKLKASTLKTEQDVRQWLAETEEYLLRRIKDGPVVIS